MTTLSHHPVRRFFEGVRLLLRPVPDEAYGTVSSIAGPGPRLRVLGMYIALGGFIYGAVMGAYGGFAGERMLQVFFSAIKVPLLIMASFALTLPSFFVLNTLLGLRSDFPQALRALVATQATVAILLAALAPYTAVWYFSNGTYHNATLFNGLMFAIACFASQWPLRRRYQPLIARNGRHKKMLIAWLVLYVFVAIQMAWILRPFIGDPERPTTFFREETWGNAYLVIGEIIWRAISGFF
ncbi:MAG: hypothetical protein WD768_11800 [Phycisphaeraceae bacterium]